MFNSLNFKVILFGFIFTFFSSFGQSFFLGLFNPSIRETLSISHGQFGTIYASATLLSWLVAAPTPSTRRPWGKPHGKAHTRLRAQARTSACSATKWCSCRAFLDQHTSAATVLGSCLCPGQAGAVAG